MSREAEEIERLRTENQKLREENEELNKLLDKCDNEWANIMKNLRNENIDMKNEIERLKEKIEKYKEANKYDDMIYLDAETEDNAEWFNLKDDDDYEIKNIYPYDIRRKDNKKTIIEGVDKQSGYIRVSLNRKKYQKHILIAKHFIYNDDPINKKMVDHINHNRADYHLSNLRWVSVSENNKNAYGYRGQKFNYLDNLPVNCRQITLFKGWEFKHYFISSDNKIWFYNGNQYRELTIYKKRNYTYIDMIDINNKHHQVGLNALIQEFNLNNE